MFKLSRIDGKWICKINGMEHICQNLNEAFSLVERKSWFSLYMMPEYDLPYSV